MNTISNPMSQTLLVVHFHNCVEKLRTPAARIVNRLGRKLEEDHLRSATQTVQIGEPRMNTGCNACLAQLPTGISTLVLKRGVKSSSVGARIASRLV